VQIKSIKYTARWQEKEAKVHLVVLFLLGGFAYERFSDLLL